MDTFFSDLSNLESTSLDAGQIFSGRPSEVSVQGYSTPSAYTPAVDPEFILYVGCRDTIV